MALSLEDLGRWTPGAQAAQAPQENAYGYGAQATPQYGGTGYAGGAEPYTPYGVGGGASTQGADRGRGFGLQTRSLRHSPNPIVVHPDDLAQDAATRAAAPRPKPAHELAPFATRREPTHVDNRRRLVEPVSLAYDDAPRDGFETTSRDLRRSTVEPYIWETHTRSPQAPTTPAVHSTAPFATTAEPWDTGSRSVRQPAPAAAASAAPEDDAFPAARASHTPIDTRSVRDTGRNPLAWTDASRAPPPSHARPPPLTAPYQPTPNHPPTGGQIAQHEDSPAQNLMQRFHEEQAAARARLDSHAQPSYDTHAQPSYDTHAQPSYDTHAQPSYDTHAQPSYDTQPQASAANAGGEQDAGVIHYPPGPVDRYLEQLEHTGHTGYASEYRAFTAEEMASCRATIDRRPRRHRNVDHETMDYRTQYQSMTASVPAPDPSSRPQVDTHGMSSAQLEVRHRSRGAQKTIWGLPGMEGRAAIPRNPQLEQTPMSESQSSFSAAALRDNPTQNQGRPRWQRRMRNNSSASKGPLFI